MLTTFELKTDQYGEDVSWELFGLTGDTDSYPTEFKGSIYESYSTHQIPMCLPQQCYELVIEGGWAVQSYSIIVDGNIVESGNANSASENILFGDSENCMEHVSTLPPTISPTPNPTIEPTKVEPEVGGLEGLEETTEESDDLPSPSNREYNNDDEDIGYAPQDSVTSSASNSKNKNTMCAVVIPTLIYYLTF
jgi:hypothetical protein